MRRAPTLLELVGVACLVMAALTVHRGLAWLVAGAGAVLKAYELDAPSRPARGRTK